MTTRPHWVNAENHIILWRNEDNASTRQARGIGLLMNAGWIVVVRTLLMLRLLPLLANTAHI